MRPIQDDLKAKFAHMMYEWYELIEWKEPLIVGLLSFHVFSWIVVYLTRKRFYFQFGFFVLIIMLLVVTEELNKVARNNWQLIATQNYFDTKGIFAAIFYAGPLLFTGFFQLALNLKNMVDMLIIVKRAEFQAKNQEKKAKKSN